MQLEAGGMFESSARLSNLCRSVMGSLSSAFHMASNGGSVQAASMMDIGLDDEDLLFLTSVPELASLMRHNGQPADDGGHQQNPTEQPQSQSLL